MSFLVDRRIRAGVAVAACAALIVGGPACQPALPEGTPAPTAVVAMYSPEQDPPVLPIPNDLAPGEAGAGGFSPLEPLRLVASEPLDPGSAGTASLVLWDDTAREVIAPERMTVVLDATGRVVSVYPADVGGWPAGHLLVPFFFGGQDAAGLRGAAAQPVLASPAFYFTRQQVPLVHRCEGPAVDCACPEEIVAAADPEDSTCTAALDGLDDALGRRIEKNRRRLADILSHFVVSRQLEDLVVAWWLTVQAP